MSKSNRNPHLLGIVAALTLIGVVAGADPTPEEISNQRLAEFEANWGADGARIASIVFQLEKHSGRRFPVLPSDTGNWGQSTPAGAIVLDAEVLQLSDSVLAGLLAHEWAHHSLGHFRRLRMSFDPGASNPQILRFEREADAYAVRFMAEWDYEVEPLARFLELSPPEQGMHLDHAFHDDGVVRAQAMRQLYAQIGAETDEPVEVAQVVESPSELQPTPCGQCGGSGWITTTQTCHSCGGTGLHLCPQCGGWGLVRAWGGWAACPRCGGEGVVPCNRCDGIGTIRISQPCDRCGGSQTTPQPLLKLRN